MDFGGTKAAAPAPVVAAPPPAATACAAFAPIYWSRADTDDTIKQVKAYNAARVALCGAPAAH